MGGTVSQKILAGQKSIGYLMVHKANQELLGNLQLFIEQKIKIAMALDKELYCRAYALHEQWSDAKLIERAENASRLSPTEAFRQYADLVEFFWKISPEPDHRQREEKLKAWDRYYVQIQKFEAWRRAPRKTA